MFPPLKKKKCDTNPSQSCMEKELNKVHAYRVPAMLPCREKEFRNLYSYLESKIRYQCSGCIYISGVPGSGKTATVLQVIRSLQNKTECCQLPQFKFLEVNGMRLTEPRQAYVQICKQITGKLYSWEHSNNLLTRDFFNCKSQNIMTILLVDELDVLCNTRQDVVYNILEWPTNANAKLIVITIANTMDLPERLLKGRVTSRLGLTRLIFQPYTHKQLQVIVAARLHNCNVFEDDAIQLVARKVAAVSGDARRALDICRRASEIASSRQTLYSSKKSVGLLEVQQSLLEMIGSAKVQTIKMCSRHEKVVLDAVISEVMRTGVEETNFLGVYTQVEIIAATKNMKMPTTYSVSRICSKLASKKLLILQHARNDIYQKILLNAGTDDVHYGLKV